MKPLSSKDPEKIGGFTLVGRLGAGGMGVVYLASRKSESVALKVVRDSLLDDEVEAARFTREISTLEKIESPHVARILETGVDDGRAWFAVEFVNGPNLSELVQDKGPLDEDRWWDLARGLLGGLADVHNAGVLHRDVKPANVIMAEGGPKLIDFGIAHVSDATSVTATGLVAGSPAWFSPEQIEGLELTSATDVFSAGSLLTYAATGLSPWGGETTMTKASVFKILTSEPDLSGLSPAQAALVGVMLEKESGDRPTAGSLLENLGSILNGEDPKLKTGGMVPAAATSGDTTVVERSQLSAGSRPTSRTTPGDATTAAKTKANPASQKRRNLLAVAAIAVVAVVGVSLVVANSSGSGAVKVSTFVDDSNKAIGDYSLRLSSSSIDPVTFDFAEVDISAISASAFSWKTGEPIRVTYTPPFSEDEAYEGTIAPGDLGLNGFDNGKVLNVSARLGETSTILSFRVGGTRHTDEVYAVRLARANEAEALQACQYETRLIINRESASYVSLIGNYQSILDRANLGWWGEGRSLAWTTWAYRAGEVVSFMQEDLERAQSPVHPATQKHVQGIVNTHIKLTDAWSDFAAASRRQSGTAFDEAASDIYYANSELQASNGRSKINNISSAHCADAIN